MPPKGNTNTSQWLQLVVVCFVHSKMDMMKNSSTDIAYGALICFLSMCGRCWDDFSSCCLSHNYFNYLIIYRPVHLQNTHRSLGFLTALLATLRNSIWKVFYISNMLLIAIQSRKFIVRTEEECTFCSVITAKSLRYKLLQIFLHTGWFCRLALTDRWYAAYWDKHQSNTQTLSAKPWKNQYLHLLEMIRIIRRWIDRSVSGPLGHLFVVCVCVCLPRVMPACPVLQVTLPRALVDLCLPPSCWLMVLIQTMACGQLW